MTTTRSPHLMIRCLAVLASAAMGGALAQTSGPSPEPARAPPAMPMPAPAMDARAAKRFPQPVRAGTLIDRALLQPRESQPVLGHVADVVRVSGDAAGLVVRLDGGPVLPWLRWAGLGTRQVVVPTSGVALLGEHVALMDLTPAQLQALPDFAPASAPRIAPDETIRVGLVGPFH